MTAGPVPPFRPDSLLAARICPSPNHEERAGRAAPDAIVLHYTGMETGAAALRRLCDPASKVSSHYVVEEDGTIVQLVVEARRAWHAGRSFWQGGRDLNSASIGIEIVNGGHDFGLPPYPEPQVAAVVALCDDITRRRSIRADRLVAHSDVAPGRKQDPGELFPWDRLHAAGLGLWVAERGGTGEVLDSGMGGSRVAALQRQLAEIGYELELSGRYDDETRIVVEAFQRHHRRSHVDGVADAGTQATLQALIEERRRLTDDRAPPRAGA